MALTINPGLLRRINLPAWPRVGVYTTVVAQAVAIWLLTRHGLWAVAVLVVLVALAPAIWLSWQESGSRVKTLLPMVPQLTMGLSVIVIISLVDAWPLTQLVAAGGFAAWRSWRIWVHSDKKTVLPNLLVVQITALQAIFLSAAIAGLGRSWTMLLVWLVLYGTTYQALLERDERAAGVLAAAWALVAAETTWVFWTWLVSYIMGNGLLIVPQPALVLAGLAYVFGSIYTAQREGKLNRARLSEYLLIGLVILGIVAAGTRWRGTL